MKGGCIISKVFSRPVLCKRNRPVLSPTEDSFAKYRYFAIRVPSTIKCIFGTMLAFSISQRFYLPLYTPMCTPPHIGVFFYSSERERRGFRCYTWFCLTNCASPGTVYMSLGADDGVHLSSAHGKGTGILVSSPFLFRLRFFEL